MSENDIQTEISAGGRSFKFFHDDPDDHIFRSMKGKKNFYESDLLSSLGDMIRPDDLVLDIGANIGNHTVYFAGVCGAKVMAFEPVPRAVDLLTKNIAANALEKRVTVKNFGVGAENGTASERFTSRSEHNLGATSLAPDATGTIQIKRLDSIRFKSGPRLIKIDVEGMDVDVLIGGLGVIRRFHPVICIEASSAESLRRICAILEPEDYVLIQSFNWTPTHIFRAVAQQDDLRTTLADIGRSAGLGFIQAATAQEKSAVRQTEETATVRQLNDVQAAVQTLGSVIERIEMAQRTSDQRLEKLAVDFSSVVSVINANNASVAGQVTEAMDELKTVGDVLEKQSAPILRVLEELRQSQSRVDQQMHNLGANLRSEMADLLGRLDRVGNRLESGLISTIHATLVERTELLGGDLLRRFDIKAEELSDRFQIAHHEFVSSSKLAQEDIAARGHSTIENLRSAIVASLEQTNRNCEKLAEEVADHLVREFGASIDSIRMQIIELETRQGDAQARLSDRLSDLVSSNAQAVTDEIASRIELERKSASEDAVLARSEEHRWLESTMQSVTDAAADWTAQKLMAEQQFLFGRVSALLEKDRSSVVEGFLSAAQKQLIELKADLATSNQIDELLATQSGALAELQEFRADLERLHTIEERLSGVSLSVGTLLDLPTLASTEEDDARVRELIQAERILFVDGLISALKAELVEFGEIRFMPVLVQEIRAAQSVVLQHLQEARGDLENLRSIDEQFGRVFRSLSSLADRADISRANDDIRDQQTGSDLLNAIDAMKSQLLARLMELFVVLNEIGGDQTRAFASLSAAVAGTSTAANDQIGEITSKFSNTFMRFEELLGIQLAELLHTLGHRYVGWARDRTDQDAQLPEQVNARAIEFPQQPAAASGSALSIAEQSVVGGVLVTIAEVSADTKDWWAHQNTKIESDGYVRLGQEHSTPGVMSRSLQFERECVLRIRCEVEMSEPLRLHVRLFNRAGQIAGDIELVPGANSVDFFVGLRTEECGLAFLAYHPRAGSWFRVSALTVERHSVDEHWASRRILGAAPSIASLASIPKRLPMLRDCVMSLLAQTDIVRVFLNEYPEVPDYLNHPRVEVRRSQDWDDKGDAGKFGWIGEADPPGLRLILDDDLIFPPDFAQKMSAKLDYYGRNAFLGCHGVLLKQPFKAYYEGKSRNVFHFESALDRDRTVHFLGTNAFAYHSESVDLRWDDFMFRNMADIWIAEFAQQRKIPMVCVARGRKWIVQNSQEGGFETIYDASQKKTRSKFDSSFVQDAVVKRLLPITIQPTPRKKAVLVLISHDLKSVRDCLIDWLETRSTLLDWMVVVANCGTERGWPDQISDINLPHELHIVEESEPFLSALRALSLPERLGGDFIITADHRIRFQRAGWDTDAATALFVKRTTGLAWGLDADGMATDEPAKVFEMVCNILPRPLFTSAVKSLRLTHGQEFFSAWRSASLDALSEWDFARPSESASMGFALLGESAPRFFFSREAQPTAASVENQTPSINSFFQKVLVINLDRRADRWRSASDRLAKAGIAAQRFAASDGTQPEFQAEYTAYRKEPPLAFVSGGVRPIENSHDFYLKAQSQAARVAYIEQTGSRAIATAGAWAYLRTYERILEAAIQDGTETLLVFDDDVVFHRNLDRVFAEAVEELPDDWMIIQLGTLQYNWQEPWMSWQSRRLYKSNGSAIGSHAVGIHASAFPFLLDHVKRMQLPFDTGALSAATKSFRDRCFVIYPNIAIQDLSDSDINSSGFQNAATRDGAFHTYRWRREDYEF